MSAAEAHYSFIPLLETLPALRILTNVQKKTTEPRATLLRNSSLLARKIITYTLDKTQLKNLCYAFIYSRGALTSIKHETCANKQLEKC